MAVVNDAAATNDPKESILKFGRRKGSPRNAKCNLSSAFIFLVFSHQTKGD
jgi:hypothetical protein